MKLFFAKNSNNSFTIRLQQEAEDEDQILSDISKCKGSIGGIGIDNAGMFFNEGRRSYIDIVLTSVPLEDGPDPVKEENKRLKMKLDVIKMVIQTMVGLFLLLLCSCSTPAPTAISHGIPNFAQVSPGIYRGGQPVSPIAWSYLRSIGVSNIIKLDLNAEGSDDILPGMTTYYLPIDNLHQVFLEPAWATIACATMLAKPGTFVHCEHGWDRTGLAIGCHRVWNEGWTKKKAYKEMLKYGYHPSLLGLQAFWFEEVQ